MYPCWGTLGEVVAGPSLGQSQGSGGGPDPPLPLAAVPRRPSTLRMRWMSS